MADYLRHIRLFHTDVRPFRICCNLGCGRERPFSSFFTFRDHVYTLHSGVTVQSIKLHSSQEDSDLQLDPNPPEHTHNCFEPPVHDDVQPVNYAALTQKAAATFILNVQENHRLPQSTMENIIKEVDSLYQVN